MSRYNGELGEFLAAAEELRKVHGGAIKVLVGFIKKKKKRIDTTGRIHSDFGDRLPIKHSYMYLLVCRLNLPLLLATGS